jgi:ubiquinone/menaquinone biosynthesis C-methylase UbiE/copper chaperone CopZ
MSATAFRLATVVLAFCVGGLSVWLVDHSGRGHSGAGTGEGPTADSQAVAGARQFAIEGMSCQGCADTITAALKQISGVQSAQVSLRDKRAIVVASPVAVPTETILSAIAAAGYQGQLADAIPGSRTSGVEAQDAPPGRAIAPFAAEMGKKFVDPQADIAQFVKRFENEDRDIYVKRHELVRTLGLRPGDAVADIGAGTGLFTLLFADQVRPNGIVYAVDIGPAFLKYIAEQAAQCGCEDLVTPVLNTQDSAMLPSQAINVAFLCDTYHHFEHPEKMLASLHRALRPEGRLVIIDFDLRPDSSDFVKQRARAAKETYCQEITAAGFQLIDTPTAPAVQDNFYVEFRRVGE